MTPDIFSMAVMEIAVVSAIAAFYGLLIQRFGMLSRVIARHTAFARRQSWQAINDVSKLGLACFSQFMFFLVLAWLTDVSISAWFDPVPDLLLLGAVVGVAEMGLSSLLIVLSIRLVTRFGPEGQPDGDAWLSLGRAGWMREYLTTIRIMPLPVSALMSLAYVAVEELIFRGVLIQFFLPFGQGWAVALSVLMFAAVQVPHTPSWRTAMFPVIGALVVGIVHGVLFLSTGHILPLIVAHFVFFMIAVI